jgi:hypothetical protein
MSDPGADNRPDFFRRKPVCPMPHTFPLHVRPLQGSQTTRPLRAGRAQLTSTSVVLMLLRKIIFDFSDSWIPIQASLPHYANCLLSISPQTPSQARPSLQISSVSSPHRNIVPFRHRNSSIFGQPLHAAPVKSRTASDFYQSVHRMLRASQAYLSSLRP